MLRRLTFGKSNRLSRRRDFQRVFEGRWCAADGWLVVYVAPNGLGHVRVGIPVGRRFGSAIRRNRVKRLIREALRLEQWALEPGFDLVCIPQAGRQPADLERYRRSIRRLADLAVKRWRSSIEEGPDRPAGRRGDGTS